jgi:hypothetical protein
MVGVEGNAPEAKGIESSRAPGAWWHHALAVLWTVVLALLLVGPALRRGPMLGTYDLLSSHSLTSRPGVVPNGNITNLDPITELIPWTNLAWTQVHHGVLPLWNPYNGGGMPLAFNWVSAVFSVPSLVGYLFPLRYAYTVGIVVTLVLAGTGGYVLGRVLRLRMIGALTIASIFELSGPLVAWLGFPQSQVGAWGGWLFAAGLLIVRGGRRVGSIALLAVVIACAIYAGHPETLTTLLGSAVLLVLLMLLARALPSRFGLPNGPVRRPATDGVIALVAGAGLGAPVLLPGFQLATISVRANTVKDHAHLHDMLYVLFSSFDGTPVSSGYAFGGSFFYNETAAYVGVIALVLASVGILIGFLAKRPEALALGAVGVVLVVVVYVAPVTHLIGSLPFLNQVNWLRALMPLCLVVAALAGIGIDAMMGPTQHRLLRTWPFAGFIMALVLVGAVWFFGRDGGLPNFGTNVARHVRAESFVWPIVGIAVGLAVSAVILWGPRLKSLGGIVLLLAEIAFLLSAGSGLISSSTNGAQPTKAVVALRGVVGSARVGTGRVSGGACALGVTPEANILFGIRELNIYDAVIPKASFSEWKRVTHSSAGSVAFVHFCPDIRTVGEARMLGVGYVLEPAGVPGPEGSRLVERIVVADPYPKNDFLMAPPPNEDLYSIPGSNVATLSTESDGRSGRASASMETSDPDPANLSVVTHATQNGNLRVRVTNVPGWHATIDDRPLTLEKSSAFELRAHIPPGTHHVQFRYWPPLFTAGLVAALVALTALAGALALEQRRKQLAHRRGDRSNLSDGEPRGAEMPRASASREKQPVAHAGPSPS